MWVDELLFVLMAVALIAMVVLALIVGTKKGRVREEPPVVAAPTHVPRARVERDPPRVGVHVVEEAPPPSPKPVASPVPGAVRAPVEEAPSRPEPEPIILVPEPEPARLTVPVDVEPQAAYPPTAPPEPGFASLAAGEPGPDAAPSTLGLRRATESQFFDLRYENAPRAAIYEEPSILDASPSIDDEERDVGEQTPGVVVCPHCKSKVPQTLYCIYCGNTLAERPTSHAG